MEYLPFIATENIMMEAVKRGANRQNAHEIIRRCSMEATAKMKNGEDWNLLADLAKEEELRMSHEDLKGIMDPKQYTGRCALQVEAFVEKVRAGLDLPADRQIAEITL